MYCVEGTEIPISHAFTKVKLPTSTTIIKDQAFANSAFQFVVIPDGCNIIGAGTFEGNAKLLFVDIPASVMQIDETAFNGCSEGLIFITESGSVAEAYASERSYSVIIK